MGTQTFLTSRSMIRAAGLLVLAGVLSYAHRASAQEACPLVPGATPPADPRVTAQQVEDRSASLMDFARAVRDQYRALIQEAGTPDEELYLGCLVRQDGTAYRAGSTYLVSLTPDGRVFIHAKAMRFAGRQLNPHIFGTILYSLGVSITDLTNLFSPDPATAAQARAVVMGALLRQPDAPFDASTAYSDEKNR